MGLLVEENIYLFFRRMFCERDKNELFCRFLFVLDDSWIAFCGDYKPNKEYTQKELCPNVLFINIDNSQTVSDLFFNKNIDNSGIIVNPFNFYVTAI